jgi:FtsZ-binding cell division protein ZapB
MPDKKLTDSEIIKVLECCSKPVGENCKECPLHLTDCLKVNIDELALDLINRLQLDNERLKNEVFAKEQECIDMQEQRDSVESHLETAKAEAYKECIENAKEELYEWVGADSSIPYSRIKKVLDNLLKEKVGEG